MYIIQTVQTPSPWRPQLPLPKEVTSINENMEYKNKKDSSAPSSKSKWSFGGFFRKKKKDLDSDSTTEDDFKAGFKSPPGQQKRNKNNKPRKSRPSKLMSGFDHIIVSPSSSLDKYRETDSLNSTDRVPSIDCSRSNTGSFDRRNRRERAKSRIESRGNSSSEEDSHNSLNSNSLTRFKSDESISNLSGSLNRKSRTARNDRYMKRLSKEESGMSPTTTLSIKGSSNSVDASYINQKPVKLQNSSSLTQLLNGSLKPFVPSPQSFQSSAQSVNNPHMLLKSPPIPPPRDPQRRLTINNPLVLDSRPISYAFDKITSSQSPQSWNLNNRCVSDDKLWGTSNLSNPLMQRPASVQSSNQPQRRYITRHETESLVNRNLLPSNQNNGYIYVADVAPRSRKPLHIVEDKMRDLQPPLILSNSQSPKPTRETTSPISSASNFWRKIDQEEIERRSRPNEIVKPRLIKPRSASSSRISVSGLSYPMIQPKESIFSSPTTSTSSSSFRQFGALESKVRNPARHEKRNATTVIAVQPSDSKSNSMPTYYKKLSSPPLINKYEEYIVKRNKTQPVSEYDLKSVLTLYPLKKPPEPPQRNLSKRNSAIESDILTALPIKPAPKTKPGNLDDAINELEAIYNSLKLYDDSIFDRAQKRDIPNPAASFNDFVKNNTNIKEFEDDEDDTPVGEPDVVRDDVVVRNIKHANSILKTVEPQPPFGIPIGPIPPKPISDYLTVKGPEKPKLSFIPRRSPDLVADDLAYRALRKDSGQNGSAGIKLDQFALPNKKKRAMRSMSANIYNLIHRDAAKPSGGNFDDYFNLEKALEKAESLTDLNNTDNDHPSTLWLLKKNRREERDRKTGPVFNLPSTLNSSPAGQPFISNHHKSSAKEHHDVLDALVREAKETSEKLGQDLIELRNDKQTATKNHILKEIDEVSKAAKLCEDILKEVTNNVLNQVDEKPAGEVKPNIVEYAEKLDDEIDPIVKLDKKITELENQKTKLINQNLLIDIDEVAENMKNCEKYLLDEMVSPDSSSTLIDHSPSPYEKSRLKEMIELKSNKINDLIANLEPETETILKITERCQNELNKINKESDDDEPNYVNLDACETDTIDLIIFSGTPDIVENDDEIELSVNKQLTLVDDIDKIIQEAAEVIKENNTINTNDNNNNNNIGMKLLSDDDNGKSSSTTPNRVNSSSITSFNPMSSSDYLKSPSSEYRPPSDNNIKSSSTTSYDVKSSSVTPNHINNSFSDSNDDYDSNNNNNNNDNSNNNNSNSINNNNDSSQYNSSEELAMIFGMTPQTPTDKLSEFSNTANYSCHTLEQQNNPSDLTRTTTNSNLINDNSPHDLVSSLENVSNSKLNASPSDLINLYDSSGEDLYYNSEEEVESGDISESGHSKLFDIICKESDFFTTNMNNKNSCLPMETAAAANKRKRSLSSSAGASIGQVTLKPEKRVTTRSQIKCNKDEITKRNLPLNNNNNKLEKENGKDKTNNDKTDSSSGTGRRYILRSNKIPLTKCDQQTNFLVKSTKSSTLRSNSTNPSSRSRISSSSGTLTKSLVSGTANNNETKEIKPLLNRPKSTPAIINPVGASQKMTSSTESSSISSKLQNPIRTTRASRLRAASYDAQRTKEGPGSKVRAASKPRVNNDDGPVIVSPPLFHEDNLQDKLNKSTVNNLNKKLIPSIAVSFNQTLRDDDKTLVPFNLTEIDNESSLTILPRKRTSTMVKNGEILNKIDFGLSPVKSCDSNSSSPGNERDKSAKRKSNLNRALNSESTNDDAAAAKRRSRRQLGKARTLIPQDTPLSFIKTNLVEANAQSATTTAGTNSNNKIIDSSDLKAVTNFNNNHILKNNNNSNNFKTKDAVNINNKNNTCCSTSSSDENSRRKSSKPPAKPTTTTTAAAKINAGETRKLSANSNNNKIASSLRSQTISTSLASTSLPNVDKIVSIFHSKSDLPKIEKISLTLSANNDGNANKNPSASSLKLCTVSSKSPIAFSLKSPSNKLEEKYNQFMSECDKKITSLTPSGDILQESPSPRPFENRQANNISNNNHMFVAANLDLVIVNDDPNLLLENNVKKNITPLKLQSKSFDDPRLESVQNPRVSILKKNPNDSSSSNNPSPVTFSSSVVDTPTRTPSRQGILKKRSSLDESRSSRSQSPDERGILIRNQRRNSLEESQHGILKQRNSDPKIDNQSQNDLPTHGILKKKETPTSSESQSKHVSIEEAATIAAAELSGDSILNGNGYDVKPILKSDSSTNSVNTPRPILKKKYSSETEEIRPILKSSRKSSREENLSDTDDCIRSCLKTDSPLKRMNYTCPFDANIVLQRSKSLETQEYNNQLEGLVGRSGDGCVSSTVLSTLDKPVVTVSERIRNMEKLLGAVPKTTLLKRNKDRFKTQPVTLEEFNSVQKSCASIFKANTSLESLDHLQSTNNEKSVNLYKFSQSSQALSTSSQLDFLPSSLSSTSATEHFNYFGEISSSNMTDSNNSGNPSDLFDSNTSINNNNDDDDGNKEKRTMVNLVRKPSIKDRAKFLEKMANNQRDDDKMKKPLMNRSQHPPKINIRDSATDSNDLDGEKINKSLSTSSISNEAAATNSSVHNEGGGSIFKPKMGCVGLFPSALNSELKNRLKKSTHASVANLKKSKSNILDSTTFSSYNDNSNNNNNNNEINSSHDSSSDSDNIIVPSKNLAQALRNLSSSSTTSQSAFAGVDKTVDRINNNSNNNNSDDTKSLISNLKNFDKTIKEQVQQQHQHSSTSEGESSGGREISEIIKNSAIARRKKYSDGYENWTAPEYYKAAEDNVIKERNNKLKIANLEKRRKKLRTLLDTENAQYESEIEELTRPKSKRYSTNMLNDIVTNIKSEKYRTDLESKLYGKWRYGLSPDREKILFESKNENIAMAKLSWLDKQVELHLQKEQCAKESEERKIKLEQERRKHEEFLIKTRESRESEIKQLRSIQENHMHELKLREDDGNRLKNNEELLHCHKQNLEDLLKLVESNFLKRKEQSVIYFNIRKIKMLFRKRSNEIQNDLQEDITVLQKLVDLNASEKIISVLQKFERQLVIEREHQKLIECMYESEVKCQLIKQQSQWTNEISVREILLKNVIVDELESVTKKCAKCIEEQKYLLDVRQSLLTAISDLNDRLKALMREENEFSKSNVYDVDENLEKVQEVIKKDDGGRLEPPRFGRKKVAWV